jgi:hypothetical protein
LLSNGGETELSTTVGCIFQQPPAAQLAVLYLGEPDGTQLAFLVICEAEM